MITRSRTSVARLAIAALAAAAAACAPALRSTAPARVTVRAQNPLAEARADEMVSVPWAPLARALPALSAARVRVVDVGSSSELVAQPVDSDGDGTPDELLVLASFGAGETKRLAVEAAPPARTAVPRAYARHIVERDDIAWENDRVAFRTYGQGLWKIEPQTRTSGIDVWTKRTRALVIDRWYAKGAGGYHRDDGEGADFYSVGLSLGAGGTAIWRDSALHRPLNFRSQRIVADGPIRTILELEYDPWDAAGIQVSETKRIQVDAGTHFFRSQSTYRFAGIPELTFATGTVKRAGLASAATRERPLTWLTTWGPVDTRQGGHGDLGTAVILDGSQVVDVRETTDHHLVLARVRPGVPVVHHVGAGWTASGDFASAEDWTAHASAYARRLASPLTVTIEGAAPPAN